MPATIRSSICFPRLLSKNVKIEMYGTIILPVYFCECESWCFTLRVEHAESVQEFSAEEGVRPEKEGKSNGRLEKTA